MEEASRRRYMSPNQPAETVIFLHVPKAAGSSFTDLLQRNYAGGLQHANWSDLGQALPDSTGEAREPRAVAGHLGAGAGDSLPGPCRYITVLREPVTRIVSLYHYAKRQPGHHLHDTIVGSDLGLRDFATSDLHLILDNFQVRQFSGARGDYNKAPSGSLGTEDLEAAKSYLRDSVDVVGLSEDFDGTVVLCRRVFGWRHVRYTTLNVTGGTARRAPLDAATCEAIAKRNHLDVKLYDFARELFDAQVEAYGRSRFWLDRFLYRLGNRVAAYLPKA